MSAMRAMVIDEPGGLPSTSLPDLQGKRAPDARPA